MNVFELMASISLDTGDYEDSIDDIEGSAGSAEAALGGIGDAADDAAGSLDDVGDVASAAAGDLDEAGDAAEDASDGLDSLSSDADDASGSLDSLCDSANDLSSSLDNISSSSGDALSNISDFGDSLTSSLVPSGSAASEAVSSVSDVVEDLSKGDFVAAAIAAVAGVGKGIYNMASESKDSSVIIAQGTGATGEALDELAVNARNALGEVSLTSKTNLADVSETLAEMNTRFGYTGEQLEDTTAMMTDFAIITGQDGAAACDAIADTMSHWHLSAEDMPGLLDDLVTASQASGASATELESALSDNSAAFQQLGMDTEDALAFLAAYVQSGGDASDASTILRQAVSNMTGEVENIPDAFQAAIDTIMSADSASEALTATVGDTGLTVEDVFGTRSANKMIAAVQSEQFSIEDMSDCLQDNSGQMEQTADDSRRFSDTISSVGVKIKNLVKDTGDDVKKSTSDMGAAVDDTVEGVSVGMENAVSSVWEGAQNLGRNIVDGFKSFLGISSPSTVMKEQGEYIVEGLMDGIADMPSEFNSTLSDVSSTISDWGKSAMSAFKDTGSQLLSSISTSFSDITSKTNSWSGTMQTSVKTMNANLINNIKTNFTEMSSNIQTSYSAISSNTSSWSSSMLSTIKNACTNILNNVKSNFTTMQNNIRDSFSKICDNAVSWSGNMLTEMKKMGTNIINSTKSDFTSMRNNITDSFNTMRKDTTSWGNDVRSIVDSSLSGVAASAGSWGRDMVSNFESGIMSRMSSLLNTVRNMASQIRSYLSFSVPEKGPLSDADTYMPDFMELLAEGIDDNKSDVINSVKELTGDISDAANGSLSSDISFGTSEVSSANGISGQIAAFNANFDKLFELLAEYFPQFAAMSNMDIKLDSGELVGALAEPMDKALGRLGKQKARAAI